MNSLRMLCSTGMDWLAHSMRRLPRSARSIFLISNEAVFTTDVAIVSCLRILVLVAIRNRRSDRETGRPVELQITRSCCLLACRTHLAGRRGRTQRVLAQLRSLVDGLPGKVRVLAAEVPVSCRLPVNRTA